MKANRLTHTTGASARILALAFVLLAAAFVASAQAATPPPLLAQFCNGSHNEPLVGAAGHCFIPRGVAVNPTTGHAYVADQDNNRIQEFTTWGAFVRTWGGGVITPGAAGTGTVIAGSTTITAVQTTEKSFEPGQTISGSGIAAGTIIASVGPGTITLSKPAGASASDIPLSVAPGTGQIPVNERQAITVTATGGTFNLRFETPDPSPSSQATTANLPFNATAAQVQGALEGLSNIGAGNVAVTAPGPGGPFTVEFKGARFANSDVEQLSLTAGSPPLSGGGAGVSTAVEGAGAFEICNVATDCKAGVGGSSGGQFSKEGPAGVTVDSAHNVYVFDWHGNRVQKFDSEGHFLLMFGGEVDKTTNANICTVASGDECGIGVEGTEPGVFSEAPGPGSFVAAGPSNVIYVGDKERVQEFDPSGAFIKSIPLPEKTVQSLAVDSTGNLYLAFEPKPPKRPLEFSEPNVQKLDPSGASICTLEVKNPRAVSVDGSGNAYVVNLGLNAEGTASSGVSGVLEFNPTCGAVNTGAKEPGFGSDVLNEPTGIATSNACGFEGTDIFVTNGDFGKSFVNLYGPPPNATLPGCEPPEVPPSINAQFATTADTAGATLKAKINPHFWPDTRYYVQYGTGKCSEGGCTNEQPASPGSLLTKETRAADITTAGVFLTGLVPNTTYHYRFVAQSGGGGPVRGVGGTEAEDGAEGSFRTLPVGSEANSSCSNPEFRTGASAKLPDCRAYEMVSPVDKNGGDVAVGASSFPEAASGGGRMTFSSFTAFAGPESAPLDNQYLARRQAGVGWTTESLATPRNSISLYPHGGSNEHQYKGFSEDLCSAWALQDTDVALVQGAPAAVPNIYRRGNCGGEPYELLTSTPPPGFGFTYVEIPYNPQFQGASADSDQSIFRAPAPLAVASGDPTPPFSCFTRTQAESITYRWLRDGAPIPGAVKATYTPTEEDQGHSVQCQVRTGGAEGTSVVASAPMIAAPLPAVAAPSPGANSQDDVYKPLRGAPTVTGTPQVGGQLTCTPGPWKNAPPSFTYRWLRNGVEIAGAAASTYPLIAADKGTAIQCEIGGENAGGSAIADSAPVVIKASPPLPSGAPTVSGNSTVGETLTCVPGSWSNGPTFTYQWLRGGSLIPGATTSTYTLAAADEGQTIQCRVTGGNSDSTALAVSVGSLITPPPATTPPALAAPGTIAGQAKVHGTLTCEPGSWSGSPTFAYQWLRNGATIPITTQSYKLVEADRDKSLQCQVEATNAGGSAVAIDAPRYVDPAPALATVSSIGVFRVYETDAGALHLISVLPDGTPAETHSSLGTLGGNLRHALSADGSRAFWTAGTGASPGEGSEGDTPGKLYLRLNAIQPQSQVSSGQCTEPEAACTITISADPTTHFIDADPQGSRVLYTVGKQDEELYEARIEESGGQMVATPQLIAAGVKGVMGASEDATRVYFASTEVLGGGPANGNGDVAVAGKPNLYLHVAGGAFTFIGTLGKAETANPANTASLPTPIAKLPSFRTARISPDGLHAAFTTNAPLTGYDNADVASEQPDSEVYVFDASAREGAGALLCASCNRSGARPSGRKIADTDNGQTQLWAAAQLPGWNFDTYASRLLSDNGNRLFFDSYDSLVPGDSNGKEDVYEWEAPGEGDCTEEDSSFSEANGGCVSLITSGQSAEDSEFFDATPTGSDVFFATQSSLLPQDPGLTDVYDARINGGLPGPATPAPGCEGEACQGPLAAPNDPTPGSSSFEGAGNVVEKPVRKKHKKHKKKHHRSNNRRNAR